MEENKFEKQVQSKLEELKIPPSDAVWENVSMRIEKRRNRRGVILMLFLVAGVLLTGGLWYYNSLQRPSADAGQASSVSNVKQKQDAAVINENDTNEGERNPEQQKALLEKNISGSTGKAHGTDGELKMAEKEAQNDAGKKPNKSWQVGKVAIIQNTPRVETVDLPANDAIEKLEGARQLPKDSSMQRDVAISLEGDEVIGRNTRHADSAIAETLSEKPVLKNDTSTTTVGIKKLPQNSSKYKWHVGLFIAGGISHVGNQFLGLGYARTDYTQYANSSGGLPIPGPSEVKNGAGLMGGVFLEKNISEKTKFSFGINYKELNTSNLVGQRNATTGNYSSTNVGDRYKNNFQFIELPIAFKVQLGSSKAAPVWGGGVTVSQLIKSSALQFNPSQGIFYKDNSLFNKTQIGFSTTLSLPVFAGPKNTILLGPYFYYAPSKVANEGLYGKKHFVFFGLRSEIILGKK